MMMSLSATLYYYHQLKKGRAGHGEHALGTEIISESCYYIEHICPHLSGRILFSG
jgi:hypothetical protein